MKLNFFVFLATLSLAGQALCNSFESNHANHQTSQLENQTFLPIKRGDKVSFYNRTLKGYDYGIVGKTYENGTFQIQIHQFHDGGKYSTFETYQAHISQVGTPIAKFNGLKIGDKVCHKGKKADVETIFTNGTAELIFGDFFGARFLIFERSKIVELSDIELCI